VTVLSAASGGELAAVEHTTGGSPYDVAATDLTDDGIVDLAVADSGSAEIVVLAGACA
jgi:hypothetical protein